MFDTAVKLNREGGNAPAIVKFLERLERNPSAASRSQLFAWLKAGGFSITSDGLVVGFKAVTSDGFSISQGVSLSRSRPLMACPRSSRVGFRILSVRLCPSPAGWWTTTATPRAPWV